ncbi:MAG: hypothetical protein ABJO02_18425, partial [Reichenbachiella sp.]|uniref:hypothetical protein n=1 Tax=Reichenbachiella sp. TaxID=2184521 RepID=UPI00329A568D
MHNLRKYIRVVSAFLLINFLFSTFLPTISYALTSGPTAPEATSFEPIDTTDMVNLQTGDFTYNIPLLEVPGPSGGYPLSLSYHAGIMPGEEASWVGLGWTLNAGAITRNVNGFADDHKDVTTTDRLYWEGGVTNNYKVGVSVGVAGTPASVSAGMNYSQDTYKGFGVGFYAGLSGGFGNSPLSYNVSAGTNPYGGSYASAGLNVGAAVGLTSRLAGNLSLGFGKSTNAGVYGGGGIGVSHVSIDKSGNNRNQSLLGASISSVGNSKASFTVGGGSGTVTSDKSGNISTSSGGWNISIPTPIYGLWADLGKNYQRYWIDETENVKSNGALYFPNSEEPLDHLTLTENAYDSYFTENGVLMPNFDDYRVSAQGLIGSIRPYMYQGYMYNKNDNTDSYFSLFGDFGTNSSQPKFRFDNDFSNSFKYSPKPFELIDTQFWDDLQFEVDFQTGTTLTGEHGNDEFANGELPGSKHIEYYTNNQIALDSKFIETKSAGLAERALLPGNQIGAFLITNESGVTYHYSLPAYSYDEYFYSENINDEEGDTFNELKKPEKYAYTWYLTAITGPDFVDRGGENGTGNGELDENDWGYWVEFDYGMWTDNFRWRNPGEGTHNDLDANFKNYSTGKKELYYLNKISTKTHVALFVKEIRADGKGVISKGGGYSKNIVSDYDQCVIDCQTDCAIENNPDCDCSECSGSSTEPGLEVGPATLKLSTIHLLKRDEFEAYYPFELRTVSSNYELSTALANHYGDNVIDIHDLEYTYDINSVTQRQIKFNHDYSLVPGTTNSFDPAGGIYYGSSSADWSLGKLGKLTLNEINVLGKNGVSLIPPMEFVYDVENAEVIQSRYLDFVSGGSVGIISNAENHFVSDVEIGELIKFHQNNKWHYGYITKKLYSFYPLTNEWGWNINFNVIGNTVPVDGIVSFLQKTKNPPYDKDAVDMWGMYKADVDKSLLDLHPNSGRVVSDISSKSVDAWSLRKIKSSQGASITIEYESDRYESGSTIGAFPYTIDHLDESDLGTDYVEIYLEASGIDYSSMVNTKISLLAAMSDFRDIIKYYADHHIKERDDVSIVDAGQNYIVINDARLAASLVSSEVLFHGGVISAPSGQQVNGGGLRTSQITVRNLLSERSTSYEYSGGVTSYEPFMLNDFYLDFQGDIDQDSKDYLNMHFAYSWEKRISSILENPREVPSPGVMYANVKVKENVDGNLTASYSAYEFEVYGEDVIDVIPDRYNIPVPNDHTWVSKGYTQIAKIEYTVRELSSILGNLKKTSLFSNNGSLITETKNHYLHEQILESGSWNWGNYVELLTESYKRQGLIHETYLSAYVSDAEYQKKGKFWDPYGLDQPYNVVYRLLGKREHYPSIMTGQTTTNFKTGITITTENLEFDYYSGIVVKSSNKDAFGNYYITESIPAYRKYATESGGMGLAFYGGKNMLIQEAANYVFRRSSDWPYNKEALLSADIQTWNNQWAYRGPNGAEVNAASSDSDPVWRKHKAYTYTANALNTRVDADGLVAFNPATFDDFESWKPTDPS